MQDLHPWGYCLTLHTASYSAPKLHDNALAGCLSEGPLVAISVRNSRVSLSSCCLPDTPCFLRVDKCGTEDLQGSAVKEDPIHLRARHHNDYGVILRDSRR